MLLAHQAGIRIFATGGLGGVHRGGESTLDISADLTELGRTPVTVISSGCKSFLDIPRTLEYLETQGVGVGTFADGRQAERVDFPAFFTRESGVESPQVIRDEAEGAAIIHAHSRLKLQSGLLFANPVPEDSSLSKAEIDEIIATAVEEAEQKGIHGAANTPYILGKIRELSGGKSVLANQALIESNVIRGTRVAVELARRELGERVAEEQRAKQRSIQERPERSGSPDRTQISVPRPFPQDHDPSSGLRKAHTKPSTQHDIVVIGSLISDTIADYAPYSSESSTSPVPQTSNPSKIKQSPGGVGRNVAVAAHYALSLAPSLSSTSTSPSSSVLLISAVADDLAGHSLLKSLKDASMSTEGIAILPQSEGVQTAQYLAINDAHKDLHLAMADTSILDHPTLSTREFWEDKLLPKDAGSSSSPKWIILDGNWPPSVLSTILSVARSLPSRPKIAFEPVSVAKAIRIISPSLLSPLTTFPSSPPFDLLTPNTHELSALYTALSSSPSNFFSHTSPWFRLISAFSLPPGGSRAQFTAIAGEALTDAGIPQQALALLPYFPCVVAKLGGRGCLVARVLRVGVSGDEGVLGDPEQAPYVLGRNVEEAARKETGVAGVYMRLFGPAEEIGEGEVKGVNGVGDTLVGVLVAALARGRGEGKGMVQVEVEDVVEVAQRAAVKTLRSEEAVGEGVKGILAAEGW
ncbi:MAG: hypothetical protein Q9160_003701 [Pyrenula sp. 1 TL-2023]